MKLLTTTIAAIALSSAASASEDYGCISLTEANAFHVSRGHLILGSKNVIDDATGKPIAIDYLWITP